MPLEVEKWILNHWTAREGPVITLLNLPSYILHMYLNSLLSILSQITSICFIPHLGMIPLPSQCPKPETWESTWTLPPSQPPWPIYLQILWFCPWDISSPLASTSITFGFPGDALVKNQPAMQEMQAPSLNGADPLEEEVATHSSILAWKIPRTGEPGALQSMGWQKVRLD